MKTTPGLMYEQPRKILKILKILGTFFGGDRCGMLGGSVPHQDHNLFPQWRARCGMLGGKGEASKKDLAEFRKSENPKNPKKLKKIYKKNKKK